MKFKSMGGLTVKDGQLVNDRPIGVSGIAKAVELNNMIRTEKKISIVTQGNLRADVIKGIK